MRSGLMSAVMLGAFAASLAVIAADAPARMQADLRPVDGRDARPGLRGSARLSMDALGPQLVIEAEAPLGLTGELLRVDACEGTVGWIRLQPGADGMARGRLDLGGMSGTPDCHPGDSVTLRGRRASARGRLVPIA